jgi:hypothetical protein
MIMARRSSRASGLARMTRAGEEGTKETITE